MNAEPTRAGRPRAGTESGRARILAAARTEFAAQGFQGTTLRSIAASAGVDVALIGHHFGNKEGLFAATLELPAGGPQALFAALKGPPEGQAERLTRAYFSIWENPETRDQVQALTRSAFSQEHMAQRLHELLVSVVSAATEAVPGGERGFALAMSHLFGTAVARHVLRIPALVAMDAEELIAATAPAVELHLRGDARA